MEDEKTELSFTEKLMVDCFRSSKKVFEELAKEGKEKFTKEDLVTTAHTFYISAMNNIRDSKRAKVQSQQGDDSATDGQIAYLKKLGYTGDTDITKREASQLIDELKNKQSVVY